MQDPSKREQEREKLSRQWSSGERGPEAIHSRLDRMAQRGGVSQARSRAKSAIKKAARQRDGGAITAALASSRAAKQVAAFPEFSGLAAELNLLPG
jgi:hypothetical protein